MKTRQTNTTDRRHHTIMSSAVWFFSPNRARPFAVQKEKKKKKIFKKNSNVLVLPRTEPPSLRQPRRGGVAHRRPAAPPASLSLSDEKPRPQSWWRPLHLVCGGGLAAGAWWEVVGEAGGGRQREACPRGARRRRHHMTSQHEFCLRACGESTGTQTFSREMNSNSQRKRPRGNRCVPSPNTLPSGHVHADCNGLLRSCGAATNAFSCKLGATSHPARRVSEAHPGVKPPAALWKILGRQLGRAREFCLTVVFCQFTQNYPGCRPILQSWREPVEPPRRTPTARIGVWCERVRSGFGTAYASGVIQPLEADWGFRGGR